jgi:hypothetical protein
MFSHLDNLENKIDTNYKSQKKFFEDFRRSYYLPWQKANLGINTISKESILRKVALLEKYHNAVDDANDRNRPRGKPKGWITFQSKFRPSVLEEFCFYLLKDLPEIKKLGLEFRKKKIHAGFEINSKGEIISREKDVDCCIVKAAKGEIEKKKLFLIIPIIAVECKTYLDGTMWNESQYSAILLKRANSSARVYVLTENNQVKLSKITKESPVDDIFVIRDPDSSKIDLNVIMGFLEQIRKDLLLLINPSIIKIPGRLINYC